MSYHPQATLKFTPSLGLEWLPDFRRSLGINTLEALGKSPTFSKNCRLPVLPYWQDLCSQAILSAKEIAAQEDRTPRSLPTSGLGSTQDFNFPVSHL